MRVSLLISTLLFSCAPTFQYNVAQDAEHKNIYVLSGIGDDTETLKRKAVDLATDICEINNMEPAIIEFNQRQKELNAIIMLKFMCVPKSN